MIEVVSLITAPLRLFFFLMSRTQSIKSEKVLFVKRYKVYFSHFSTMSSSLSVIGAGRLGLAVCIGAAAAGYKVMAMDVDEMRVEAINKCHPDLKATTSLEEALKHSDFIYILVPTPEGPKGYDHEPLVKVLEEIAKLQYEGQVVIGSTVLPGFMDSCEAATNADYNPLFVRQGKLLHDLKHPSLVLIGARSETRADKIECLHRALFWLGTGEMFANTSDKDELGFGLVEREASWRVFRLSPKEAEIAKLSINCFLTMKIAFANTIGDLAEASGCRPKEILGCVGADSRIGHQYMNPGYGYGGPCLPRDNRALGFYAESLNINPCMFVATDMANRNHARVMAAKLLAENRENYVFDSVSYKSDVDYIEDSQQLQVANHLRQAGRRVTINERPHVVRKLKKIYGDFFEYTKRKAKINQEKSER